MAGGDVETSDKKFQIPKGTVIFPNLYHVVNDPSVFENPRLFNPNRFLDENGNFIRSDRMIVFGIGKNYLKISLDIRLIFIGGESSFLTSHYCLFF